MPPSFLDEISSSSLPLRCITASPATSPLIAPHGDPSPLIPNCAAAPGDEIPVCRALSNAGEREEIACKLVKPDCRLESLAAREFPPSE